MSVIELTVINPSNNAVFDGLSSDIAFEGSATTSVGAPTTDDLYFKWFSTVAPWASETGGGNAHINTDLQGANALSFSESSPGGDSWGMGTQWVQFACMNTSGMNQTALESVTTNGIDGGKNTITLAEWTINPRMIHILGANFIHPSTPSRFSCYYGASNNYESPVSIYWEVRDMMSWITSGTGRNTHSVTNWNTDTDDELVFELHDESIGTVGDAIFKSDENVSTWVFDLEGNGHEEDGISCLSWDWSTSTGSKTLYLLVYHKDNRVTSGTGCVSASTSFYVVDDCPEPP